MLARKLSAAAILSISFLPSPAPAASLSPIDQWVVEPSDLRCVAVRKYGEAEKPMSLALKASPSGGAIQIGIIRHAYRKTSDQVGATVTIDGRAIQTQALGYPLSGNKQAVSLINLSSEEAAILRKGSNLEVNIKGSPDWQFPLGPMTATWKQVDACLERLRATWNMSDDGRRRLAKPPRELVPFSGMISPRDFPPQAMAGPWGGTTGFLLLVDEKGTVKDCTLTETSGKAVIDSRTCALISYKARFEPAADVEGRPVKSSRQGRITWRVIN